MGLGGSPCFNAGRCRGIPKDSFIHSLTHSLGGAALAPTQGGEGEVPRRGGRGSPCQVCSRSAPLCWNRSTCSLALWAFDATYLVLLHHHLQHYDHFVVSWAQACVTHASTTMSSPSSVRIQRYGTMEIACYDTPFSAKPPIQTTASTCTSSFLITAAADGSALHHCAAIESPAYAQANGGTISFISTCVEERSAQRRPPFQLLSIFPPESLLAMHC